MKAMKRRVPFESEKAKGMRPIGSKRLASKLINLSKDKNFDQDQTTDRGNIECRVD